MLNAIIRRFRYSRTFRRSLAITTIVLLYLLFTGFVSELVDQKTIEHDLKIWFEKTLNDSTYVDIDHTDTALRSNWRTDLYIHELEIASPQPEFILPVLAVDTVRASSGFYSLFGGVAANPVIQIRDGILNIQRNARGDGNTDGLQVHPENNILKFLPNININIIDFVLMNCRLILDLDDYTATIPLNGDMYSHKNELTLKAISPKAIFTSITDTDTKETAAAININDLTLNYQTMEIVSCNVDVEKLPLYSIKALYPDLPDFPDGLNFTGKISHSDKSILISGQLENIGILQLPRYLDFTATTDSSFLADPKNLNIVIKNKGTTLLSLKAEKDQDDKWKPLQMFISAIDINKLLSSSESFWTDYLVSTFPAINAIAYSATISNFDIGEAAIKIIRTPEKTVNISLDGMIAQGKLTLLARNISLKNNDLPETIMATLEINDAANTLVKFSKNLPPILYCTPTQGNGELAILYKRSDTEGGPGQTKVQLKLNDVIIPSLGSGTAITTLASIPNILNRLNRLCYDPVTQWGHTEAELIEPFSDISLDSLTVSYEKDTDGSNRLISLEAQSPEIGYIQGRLTNTENKDLKFILSFFNLPPETVERARLSDNSAEAYYNYIIKNPLSITLTENNNNSNEENSFIQDIYSTWLNSQKLVATGENE